MEMLQMVAVVLALLFFGCGGEAPTRPEEVQEKIYSAGELRYLVEQKPDDAKKLEGQTISVSGFVMMAHISHQDIPELGNYNPLIYLSSQPRDERYDASEQQHSDVFCVLAAPRTYTDEDMAKLRYVWRMTIRGTVKAAGKAHGGVVLWQCSIVKKEG